MLRNNFRVAKLTMSRIVFEVTSDQHQVIKALAATEGQSIKDFILTRILPPHPADAEEEAWNELREILASRIINAQQNGVSQRSVSQITEDTLQRLGKV